AGIWGEVLGREQVGVEENFFELGGHSLLATQMVSRVRQAFRTEVQLRWVFESPTVAGLSRRIEEQQRAGIGVRAGAIERALRDGDLALSFAQERLWFIEQMESGTGTYNIPAGVKLEGELKIEALEQSLREVVRRHEVLRTSFIETEGEPRQVVRERAELGIAEVDLSGLDAGEQERAIKELQRAESGRGFDLAAGPLIRGRLLRIAEQEQVLLLTMHHIVSDGWSSRIIIEETASLYDSFTEGQPSGLNELPIQYADYAVWQREWLQGEELERQVGYWKEKLAGVSEVLELPTDRPRAAVQSHRGAVQPLQLSSSLSGSLKALSQRNSSTHYMTMVAALKTLLYRYSGQRDIAVGSTIAGRTRAELEGLIGFFVNTLVLRTELGGEASFEQLLAEEREGVPQAQTDQDWRFEQRVEELQPQRSWSHTPLFQVMVTMDNTPTARLELAKLKLQALGSEIEGTKFDLTLGLRQTEDGLSGSVQYREELFDAVTIQRLVRHFERLLQEVVSNPKQRLNEIKLLSEAEQHQLLQEWNNSESDYQLSTPLHRLIEEQVKRTPDRIAIVGDGQQVNYA